MYTVLNPKFDYVCRSDTQHFAIRTFSSANFSLLKYPSDRPLQALHPQSRHNQHPQSIHQVKLALLLSQYHIFIYLQIQLHLLRGLDQILPQFTLPIQSRNQIFLLILPLVLFHFTSDFLEPAIPHLSPLILGQPEPYCISLKETTLYCSPQAIGLHFLQNSRI